MTNSDLNSRSLPGRRALAAAPLFAEGQTVRFKNAYIASGNVYSITASLPPLGASPQYRIRSEAESFERMAMETDLELVTRPAANPNRMSAERLFDRH